jgi:mannose-1-phosphate guanylyltransferase
MRAVVLVGGFGTRLRPLTDDTPKPMLPVGHRPMITGMIERLAAAGVTEVTLALGFRPEPFMAAFPDGRCGEVELRYAVEPEPLDTAGAIRFAADHAGIDDTFVVANGDVITDLDIAALVSAHRTHGGEATIHLTPVADPSAFGVVESDRARVMRFVEKPAPGDTSSNLINAGTYVFEASVLDRIPAGRRCSVERETFQTLVAEGTLCAHPTDDYWIDTGRPEFYLQANLDMINGRRTQRCEPVASGADVDPAATLVESLVGAGAVVEHGARLVRSVVLPGGHVGRDALVEDSTVMGSVGDRAVVRHAVIGAAGAVPAAATVVAARVPEPS